MIRRQEHVTQLEAEESVRVVSCHVLEGLAKLGRTSVVGSPGYLARLDRLVGDWVALR